MNTAKQASPLLSVFKKQKQAFQNEPYLPYSARLHFLKALKKSLLTHQTDLISALNQDYNGRSEYDTMIGDTLPTVSQINYTISKLKKWMKPESRSAGAMLAPASVKVHYQPKGVVGIIVPWNFPIMLSLSPLATAIAAGNRVMLKLSEFTPSTNVVIRKIIETTFSENHIAVVEGEADVAAEFSALPFDHLLFTGSTQVGRHVMRAAADNLTPVTLELGGKSPVIIAPDMKIETAVERLIYGKCLNAGQICVAPDYILCPSHRIAEFIDTYQQRFQAMYQDLENNSDYTSIINQRQFERLVGLLDDAREKGAKIISASNTEIDKQQRKFATQLVTNVTDNMQLMQQEIFGPILPIVAYDSLDESLDYINQRPRPLALYIMSFDTDIQNHIISQTHSGGVSINDTVMQVAVDDAPFGGIGPSGMGHYHGKEGFRTFSHAKTVLKKGWFDMGKFIHPPYGTKLQKFLLGSFLK
ncbi:coniferyl aldehyde dehydrogenase [Parashewanella tropica]|uniref:coniferyl aldehyde dehydrogenase n=1 Tax=Parashewanella tropica TaxID=2547970 RepID=UPI0010596C73|nr:coniferyl aldehyde dehydrogenase [Parashewanella tropica]